MSIELITLFVAPVLFFDLEELKLWPARRHEGGG
jgi:hypothetical protein